MSRTIRIEFPNARYHVTACGDRGENIFEDDHGRHAFLETLDAIVGELSGTDHYSLLQKR